MPSSDRAVGISFRVALYLCGCLLAGSLAGCGSGDPYSYVKVNGKVSYDDGTPIKAAGIRLTFIPENPPTIDEKTHARPAVATIKPDGTFDIVTTHTVDDGLLPGKHKVVVFVVDDRNQQVEGIIPREYGDPATTPIEVDTANLPMEIKIKKAAGGAANPAGSR